MDNHEPIPVLQQRMRSCRLCADAGHQVVPGAIFSGDHSAQVMIIGQAPGVTELEAGRPFNASSGRRLFKWLEQAGWDENRFRERHYMTAVTKCYPGKNNSGRGDRVPSKAEQSLCRPYLDREITLINPSLIIPVGGLAIKLFYPAQTRLSEVIGNGRYFPPEAVRDDGPYSLDNAILKHKFEPGMSRDGRWLVPLPHPSGASQWPNLKRNRILIDKAIALLAAIREVWNL